MEFIIQLDWKILFEKICSRLSLRWKCIIFSGIEISCCLEIVPCSGITELNIYPAETRKVCCQEIVLFLFPFAAYYYGHTDHVPCSGPNCICVIIDCNSILLIVPLLNTNLVGNSNWRKEKKKKKGTIVANLGMSLILLKYHLASNLTSILLDNN